MKQSIYIPTYMEHPYTYNACIPANMRHLTTNRPVQRLDRPDATVVFDFVFDKGRRSDVLDECSPGMRRFILRCTCVMDSWHVGMDSSHITRRSLTSSWKTSRY